jgi:glycyl-tRNA synthetase
MPLVKKLSENLEPLYKSFEAKGISVAWDESGSIGKRYRRQDEIGTPLCITYDFDSLTDHCVTVRHRDTTTQERVAIDKLDAYLEQRLK